MSDRKEYTRQYSRERRELLARLNLCPVCGGEPVPNRKCCADCLYRFSVYQAEHPPTEEQKRRNAERIKELRAQRRSEGLCIRCGAPAYEGRVYCYEHWLANKRYGREYCKRKREQTSPSQKHVRTPPRVKPSINHPWRSKAVTSNKKEFDGRRRYSNTILPEVQHE